MKKTLLAMALFCVPFLSFGQHSEHPDLLVADSTWIKEVIAIPFGFAPEIDHTGYEDLRFAKNWGTIESPEFWSYAFVWKIDLSTEPTIRYLEENLTLYFDGLMTAVNKEKEKTIPKTIVSIIEKVGGEERSSFLGKIRTHDSFKTRKMMTLNVRIETYYCKKTKTYLPFFRFSPQPFKHAIWGQLASVQLLDGVCD